MRTPLLSPIERRQWAGIAAGAVVVVVAWVISYVAAASNNYSGFYLVPGSVFAGGVIAGALSPRGWRSGSVSGLLSWTFGVGVFQLYILAQVPLVAAAGGHFEPGLMLMAVAMMAFVFLPVAILGGVLGGTLGQLARRRKARGNP